MKTIQTILVADDSLTERTHLSQILQAAGYEVLTAASGNEAAAMAETHQPDVIFLDIIMDDGDGYKACRTIRRNDSTREIPVIMVSSKSNPVDKKWAEKLGANGYVVKPYADEEIIRALDAV
ncbi:MAG: response regulator [Thiolinea sp.]